MCSTLLLLLTLASLRCELSCIISPLCPPAESQVLLCLVTQALGCCCHVGEAVTSTHGGCSWLLPSAAREVGWGVPCSIQEGWAGRKLDGHGQFQSYRHERAKEIKPLGLTEVVHDCSLNPEAWMSLQARQPKEGAVLKSTTQRRMWLGSVSSCSLSDCPVCTPSLLLCYFAAIYFRKWKQVVLLLIMQLEYFIICLVLWAFKVFCQCAEVCWKALDIKKDHFQINIWIFFYFWVHSFLVKFTTNNKIIQIC